MVRAASAQALILTMLFAIHWDSQSTGILTACALPPLRTQQQEQAMHVSGETSLPTPTQQLHSLEFLNSCFMYCIVNQATNVSITTLCLAYLWILLCYLALTI